MLDIRFIQPSKSPFSSPILLFKKKDDCWCCCIDYKALNTIIVKDRFSMPTIDDFLDKLSTVSRFSKLNLRQGFHQIRMADEDILKTTFKTHQGHYKYHVMPFSLCNDPTTFQAAMNELFKPFSCKLLLHSLMIYSFIVLHSCNTYPTRSHSFRPYLMDFFTNENPNACLQRTCFSI